ncbi:MAG TPA: metal ABC transporter permease [Planctomycetes bacterium]|nr:metal ABC transporter permease [Planctomycetota bacterium]HIJ71992.1 metal ABC transporter permease [Planctomycetota bacterium]
MQIIQILGLPFLACVIMGVILGYMGISVLKREVIFVDIALAQIAAVGSIAAHLALEVHGDCLTGYASSLAFVLLAAVFYAFVRRRVFQLSLEAVIGISYAIAAAGALFLVGIAPGGHLHVQTMLSGSLLWATWRDVITAVVLFSLVGFCFFIFRRPFKRISDNYYEAVTEGMNVICWDFAFYALLGVVITLAVRIAGVVAVFAFLIIPATTSAIVSPGGTGRIVITWLVSILASVGGLLFAYYLDFSIAPSIVLFLVLLLIIVSIISKYLQRQKVRLE